MNRATAWRGAEHPAGGPEPTTVTRPSRLDALARLQIGDAWQVSSPCSALG
jgi:hypothetical protein